MKKIGLYLLVLVILCSCSSTSPSLAASALWRAGIFNSQAQDALTKYPAILAKLDASSQSSAGDAYTSLTTRGDEALVVKFLPSGGGLLITASCAPPAYISNSADWKLIESEQKNLDTALRQGRLEVDTYLDSTRRVEEKKWKIVSNQHGNQSSARGEFLRQFWKRLCEQVKPSGASSLYAQAEAVFETGRKKSAFYKYLALLTNFPGSVHENVALERCFEIPASLISSSWGVRRASEILERYPCAPNADRLRFLTASTYFDWGDYEESASHFEQVFRDYPESQLAPIALYLSGKSHLCQYQGSDYEVRPLVAAKEIFEKFLRLYSAHERAKEVNAFLQDVCERLALRDLNVARFYLRTGKKLSAAAYLKAILLDYPQTNCARDAAKLLSSIEQENLSSQP